jgi:hypothetical protein
MVVTVWRCILQLASCCGCFQSKCTRYPLEASGKLRLFYSGSLQACDRADLNTMRWTQDQIMLFSTRS